MACVCCGSIFTFSVTRVWHHHVCMLCVLHSCDEWPRCWHVWASSIFPEITEREKITFAPSSPSLPCTPRCWQTSRPQEVHPSPCVIHFSLLLGDRLLLPVTTAFAPVAEIRARLRIPYVAWSWGLRGWMCRKSHIQWITQLYSYTGKYGVSVTVAGNLFKHNHCKCQPVLNVNLDQ